jgi:hypothetical protein
MRVRKEFELKKVKMTKGNIIRVGNKREWKMDVRVSVIVE